MPTLLSKIKDYLSLVKFSHTIFAMPFAVSGFFLGVRDCGEGISYRLLLLMLLCMVFARNAAMAFNRLTDNRFDKLNPRTSNREVPSQKISYSAALAFTSVNVLLFITTTYFINSLCFYLSPVALLVILGYSYTKRFTSLSHFFLGLALALAPLGAFLVVCNYFALQPVLLSFSVLFWVAGFDIIYALQDITFDRRHNLKSVPSSLGFKGARLTAIIAHIISLLILLYFGILLPGTAYIYFTGFGIFSLFVLFQHVQVMRYGLEKVNSAFFLNNGIGSLIFAVFTCLEFVIG